MTDSRGGRHLALPLVRPGPRLLLVLAALALLAAGVVLVAVRGDDSSAPASAGLRTDSPTTPALQGVAADGHRALTTWARPDTPYGVWWRELSPLLTPAARQAYAGTDTSLLPDLGELGGPEVVAGRAANTSTVWFPTDRGRFGVDLSRTAESAPWRMVRVLFPGQDSSFE